MDFNFLGSLIGWLLGGVSAYFLLRERIVKLETRSEMIEKRLDKGSETMDDLKETINQLNVTLAKLDSKIEHLK